MNRVEELTFRLIQGVLTDAEQTELTALLDGEESAKRCHVELLRLETALVGEGPLPDVSEVVIADLKRRSTADLERNVMRTIAALPSPAWSRPDAEPRRLLPRKRFVRVLTGCLAITATLFLVVWAMRPEPARQPVPGEEVIAADATAVLLQVTSDVRVDAAVAGVGRSVHPGQMIDTGEDGFAVLQYPDGTRLEFYGETRVRLEPDERGAKRVWLAEGGLNATVTPQPTGRPLVVATPHTELRVLGTRFAMTSSQDGGTRVDLESGKVELLHGQAPAMTLDPGSSAFVAPGQTPIIVASGLPLQGRPAGEIDFHGLQTVAFAPDGQTVIATTLWQAVYWSLGDQLEAVPVSPENRRSREGIHIQRLVGPMLAFTDRPHQRLVVWDTQTRKPTFERALPVPFHSISAVSPLGDWLVALDSSGRMKRSRLWRADHDQPVVVLDSAKIISYAASPDGTLLAVGRRRQTVDIWESATGRKVAELSMWQKVPHALAFSPDGSHLLIGMTGRAELWNVQRKEVVAAYEQPGVPLTHISLDPSGKRIAAAGFDDRVWIWERDRPKSPVLLKTPQRVRALAFAPNGQRLVVLGHEGRLSLWELSE